MRVPWLCLGNLQTALTMRCDQLCAPVAADPAAALPPAAAAAELLLRLLQVSLGLRLQRALVPLMLLVALLQRWWWLHGVLAGQMWLQEVHL